MLKDSLCLAINLYYLLRYAQLLSLAFVNSSIVDNSYGNLRGLETLLYWSHHKVYDCKALCHHCNCFDVQSCEIVGVSNLDRPNSLVPFTYLQAFDYFPSFVQSVLLEVSRIIADVANAIITKVKVNPRVVLS